MQHSRRVTRFVSRNQPSIVNFTTNNLGEFISSALQTVVQSFSAVRYTNAITTDDLEVHPDSPELLTKSRDLGVKSGPIMPKQKSLVSPPHSESETVPIYTVNELHSYEASEF